MEATRPTPDGSGDETQLHTTADDGDTMDALRRIYPPDSQFWKFVDHPYKYGPTGPSSPLRSVADTSEQRDELAPDISKKLHEYDFHRASILEVGDLDYDASEYLKDHAVELLRIDYLRAMAIAGLVGRDRAALDDDGEHLHLTSGSTDEDLEDLRLLRDMRSGDSRFYTNGRISRGVYTTLIEELEDTGELKTKILPDVPGLGQAIRHERELERREVARQHVDRKALERRALTAGKRKARPWYRRGHARPDDEPLEQGL